MPTRHSGGTMAVNWGAPVLAKEDRAMGRYLSKPSRVYRGIQSAVAVNWSREHSTRRPSSRRIGSQCLVITSGKSDSDAAARGTKCSKVSISFLEGVVPGSNPRRLHLMCWTQRYLQQRFHTSWGGCLPLSPLWVELLHGEACSSPPLLLLASLEVTCVDFGPPVIASGCGLVHFLA